MSRWLAGLLTLGLLTACPARAQDPQAALDAAGEDAFQLYVLGGGAAQGAPYHPRCDVGQLTAFLFGGQLDGREIVVHNLARMYKASDHQAWLAERIAANHPPGVPAVAFVYSGNHEFMLRFHPELDVRVEERALFDVPLVPEEKRAQVMEEYRANLKRIVQTLRAAGIHVVLSTLGVNLTDWEPNRSVLARPENAEAVLQFLAQAEEASAAGELALALRQLDAALRLEPGFALAWYRLGDLRIQAGRDSAARAAYLNAVGEDRAPSSATPDHNRIVREIAREHGVPLVDGERILWDLSATGVPGFEVFWDNVNPRLEGHLALAQGLATEIGKHFDATPREDVTLSEVERVFELGGSFRVFVYTGRARYFYGSSVLTFDRSRRLGTSRRYLDAAEKLDPEDPHLLFSRGVLAGMEGDAAAAVGYWRACHARDPEHYAKRLLDPYMSQLLELLELSDALDPEKSSGRGEGE